MCDTKHYVLMSQLRFKGLLPISIYDMFHNQSLLFGIHSSEITSKIFVEP